MIDSYFISMLHRYWVSDDIMEIFYDIEEELTEIWENTNIWK
jgi:hypothetical protein